MLLNAATAAVFLAWNERTAFKSAVASIADTGIVNLTILPTVCPADTDAEKLASNPKSAQVADAEMMLPVDTPLPVDATVILESFTD